MTLLPAAAPGSSGSPPGPAGNAFETARGDRSARPAAGPSGTTPRSRLDPRWYQNAVLAGLLGFGLLKLDFDIEAPQVAVSLGAVLLTQFACTKLARLKAFDPKSALISGLSLCLLLRTDHLVFAGLAGFVAIASKFVLKVQGKHVFNPTNLGITLLMALGAPVWVSPGQWGNVAFFAFQMACLGGLVVNRAARGDVTLAFLAAWATILFGRALWLGQRMSVPLHQLENGALLLFAFFMISDPRTTPRARAGRILFAALVASGAATVQFLMYRTNGLLWSLVVFSLAVPLIDRLLPGPHYEWSRPVAVPPKPGDLDEAPYPARHAVPGAHALADSRV